MTSQERFERMRTAMEAAGYPVVLTPGRGTEVEAWTRAVLAFHLYGGRWTNKRVGKMLNRDHSSVTMARQRVRCALDLPRQYDDVIEMIENFRTKYHELFGEDVH